MASIDKQYLKLLTVAVLFAVAFGLRLGAVNHTVVDQPVRADAFDYYMYALNLRIQGVYSREPWTKDPEPDALRPPGYPLFLAPLVDFPLSKAALWKIEFFQAILGSLSVLLALAIFRRFMSEPWAAVAGLLVALSPHHVAATTYLLSETLFVFLLLLALWSMVMAYSRRSGLLALIAGVLLAAGALTRSAIQYFVLPAVLLPGWQDGWRRTARLVVLSVLGFFLLFAPWLARNLSETGHLSDPRLATATLFHGMYPGLMYRDREETRGFPYRFDPRAGEIGGSPDAVLREIRRRFTDEPGRHLKWYLLGKPMTLFAWDCLACAQGDVFLYPVLESPYRDDALFRATHGILRTLHWPLVIMGFLTAVFAWTGYCARQTSREALFAVRLLSLFLFYYLAVHMVGAPFPRYGIPLQPVLYGLGLYGVARMVNGWRPHAHGQT